MTTPGDRRPIAARDWQPTQRAAAWLIRHRASPNGISLAGMGAGLLAGVAFALAPQAWPLWLAGALLVQLRLLANMMDGMVAVGRGIVSPVGDLYNEVPDRVSDSAVLAGCGWACSQPALGLAAALMAIATAYVRAIGRANGAPSDFRGPMAKQQRMALITAVAVLCAFAPARWSAPIVSSALWVIAALSLVTAARRLMGIAQALRS